MRHVRSEKTSGLIRAIGRDNGSTALHYAALRGDMEIVEILLGAGADSSIKNDLGQDAAAMCKSFPELRGMLEKRDRMMMLRGTGKKTGAVEVLGKRISTATPIQHEMWLISLETLLMLYGEVVKLLIEILNRVEDLDGDINYRMQSKSTKWKLLRGSAKVAVRCGLVKSVLANRLANGPGLTALHYAARRGDVEIVTLLLEAGADPYIENEMGLNSFDISEKFGPFPSVRKVLEEGAARRAEESK